jgi:hypothetical protein
MTADGVLIDSREHRTQSMNREASWRADRLDSNSWRAVPRRAAKPPARPPAKNGSHPSTAE